jgi:hypothetical protein
VALLVGEGELQVRPESAIALHRIRQGPDEEIVMVSIGDVNFGALVPRADLMPCAVRILEQALDWARRRAARGAR